MELWRDGSWATHMLCPAECLTVIPQPGPHSLARWSLLGWVSVAYGALLTAGSSAGSTLIVNGGTGSLGSLAAKVALALGVAKARRPHCRHVKLACTASDYLPRLQGHACPTCCTSCRSRGRRTQQPIFRSQRRGHPSLQVVITGRKPAALAAVAALDPKRILPSICCRPAARH